MADSNPPSNASTATGDATDAGAPANTRETIRETLISIIIAFALAFVFRGFVVEAFVIPTGSMAPTLMGKHMRFAGDDTGYSWQVAPWRYPDRGQSLPPFGTQSDITVHDPMGGTQINDKAVPLLSGDRILVLKYLYSILPPKPFDVIVFKNPKNPPQNYIKRLIGLPNEVIALVDGDVWVHDRPADGSAVRWTDDGWRLRRKPAHVQRAVWQPIFDSRYAPDVREGETAVRPPWAPEDRAGWTVSGRVYEYTGNGPTRLVFDQTRVRFPATRTSAREPWTIDDRYPYDEIPHFTTLVHFPVSDLNVRAGLQPMADGLTARATIESRDHVFEAVVDMDGTVTANIRPIGETNSPITASASGSMKPVKSGSVANVEFWHVDQALQVWINRSLVCELAYDAWTPMDRLEHSLKGGRFEMIRPQLDASKPGTNPLGSQGAYRAPTVSWSFDGPVKMHRVGLDRDLFYQPRDYNNEGGAELHGTPALATHPATNASLGSTQYFVLGDNSPYSLDGRAWGNPHPWVADQMEDAAPGIVPRDLLLGKAFFVYFPAWHKGHTIPAPDAGRMRLIW